MPNKKECILCGSEAEATREGKKLGGGEYFSCPVCGSFFAVDFFCNLIEKNKIVLSGYLFETKESRENPLHLNEENIKQILTSEKIPRSTIQQLNKVLLHLYRHNDYVGKRHELFHTNFPGAIGYVANYQQMVKLCGAMDELGWFSEYKPVRGGGETLSLMVSLSTQGLFYAEEIMQTSIESSKVFVAMQFRSVEGFPKYTEVRDIAIKPAVDAASEGKLRAFTVDEKEHNNYITDEIIAEIKTSKFVICDLTHNNLGAYWEAGYAKGLGKEVIYICNENWSNEKDESGKKKHYIHFDVNHINTIFYIDLADLKTKLTNRIRAFI